MITEVVTAKDGSGKLLALKAIYPNLRVDEKRNIYCSTDRLNPTHPYNLIPKGDWEKAVRKIARIKPPTVAPGYKYRVKTFIAGKDFDVHGDWGLDFMKSIEEVIDGNDWICVREPERCRSRGYPFPDLRLCDKCELAYCPWCVGKHRLVCRGMFSSTD